MSKPASLFIKTTVVAFVAFSSALQATTLNWLGSSTSDWQDPNNWEPAQLPVNGDSITVTGSRTLRLDNIDPELELVDLDIQGSLQLDKVRLGITGTATINGSLRSEGDTQIRVSGFNASLFVSGVTRIDEASLAAEGGAQITLPGLGSYTGSGEFLATGAGSLISVPNLTRIGISDSPDPILFDALSRSVSVFNRSSLPVDPLLLIDDATSRAVSVVNQLPGITDPLDIITDSISRSVSVFNQVPLSVDPLAVITDDVSRPVSVYNRTPLAVDPLETITDSTSRSVSVFNRVQLPSDPLQTIKDTTSRAVSVEPINLAGQVFYDVYIDPLVSASWISESYNFPGSTSYQRTLPVAEGGATKPGTYDFPDFPATTLLQLTADGTGIQSYHRDQGQSPDVDARLICVGSTIFDSEACTADELRYRFTDPIAAQMFRDAQNNRVPFVGPLEGTNMQLVFYLADGDGSACGTFPPAGWYADELDFQVDGMLLSTTDCGDGTSETDPALYELLNSGVIAVTGTVDATTVYLSRYQPTQGGWKFCATDTEAEALTLNFCDSVYIFDDSNAAEAFILNEPAPF